MGKAVWLPLIPFLALSGVHASVKKGIAVAPKEFLCEDLNVMDNMYWWYDWGANLDIIRKNSKCANVDQHIDTHVAMLWGAGSYFSNYYINNQSDFVLGFNEPNHYGQSNITAAKAASMWPEVVELSNGRPLVSPAAAPCGGTNCHGDIEVWFDTFFEICKGCRVDYLATHVYYCNATKTMMFLLRLHEKYKKEIWLTEFACPRSTDTDKQLLYMQELLPMLESAPFIFRYAWFVSRIQDQAPGSFVTSAISLFEPNSSTLTTLGRYYNEFNGHNTASSLGNGVCRRRGKK